MTFTAHTLEAIQRTLLPQTLSLDLTRTHASLMERLVRGDNRASCLGELCREIERQTEGWNAFMIILSQDGPTVVGKPHDRISRETLTALWQRIAALPPGGGASHAASEESVPESMWKELFPNQPVQHFAAFFLDETPRDQGALILISSRRSQLHAYEHAASQLIALMASLVPNGTNQAQKAPTSPIAKFSPGTPHSPALATETERAFDKHLLELSMDGVCLLDERGVITMGNARFADILGRPMEQLLGEKLSRFAARLDTDSSFVHEIVVGKGKQELCLKHRNGTFVWVKARLATLETSKETLVSLHDITPLKHLRATAEITQERLHSVLETHDSIVLEINHDGTILSGQGTTGKDNPVKASQFIGKNALSLCQHPRDWRRALRALLRGNSAKLTITENSIRLAITVFPNQGTDGSLHHVIAVGQALPEAVPLIRTEVSPPSSNPVVGNTLKTHPATRVLEGLSQAIFSVDHFGYVQLMNQSATNLTSLSLADGIGKPIGDILRLTMPKSPEPVFKDWTSIMANFSTRRSQSTTFECLLERAGLPLKELMVTMAPSVATTGKQEGLLITCFDITQENSARREAAEADQFKSLSILAGGIAHDLNNILTALVGNVSLANMLVNKIPEASARLVEAERACFRAKDLSHQLLTFSKGTSPTKKTVRIEDLTHQCVEFYLRGSRSVPHVTVKPGLWSVSVDEGQLSQVLENLIIHSDQAMPHGGAIEVIFENFEYIPNEETRLPLIPGLYVKMTIRDEGRGIPPEQLAHLFKPYYTPQETGGLGLATTYTVIKNHGGHIAVHADAERGTRFTVYLPATGETKDPQKDPLNLDEGGHIDSDDGRPGRILVIDDEKSIRDLASTTLKLMGCNVTSCPSSTEGIQQFIQARERGEPFDLVIMDLTIPGDLGGNEAMQQILKITPEARGIASSGYSDGNVMAHYREYGFQAALSKPYNIADLQRIVATMLHN